MDFLSQHLDGRRSVVLRFQAYCGIQDERGGEVSAFYSQPFARRVSLNEFGPRRTCPHWLAVGTGCMIPRSLFNPAKRHQQPHHPSQDSGDSKPPCPAFAGADEAVHRVSLRAWRAMSAHHSRHHSDHGLGVMYQAPSPQGFSRVQPRRQHRTPRL